jgi:hypothetical protein
MITRASLMGLFLLVTMPAISRADHWILSPGKGSLAPDKVFSDQVTNELDSRGVDWGPWIALEAVENPDSIPTAGKHYVSPDQKFSVQTTIENSQFNFLVKVAQTGQTTRLASANFPVLVLAWSPDSKSLVAVVHASMTSFIKVIHWNGSSWDQFEIDAPEGGDNDKYHVIGWEFKTGYLEATYIVDHRAENGASLDLYRCSFYIDPASGEVSRVSKTAISQKEFISLRNGGN